LDRATQNELMDMDNSASSYYKAYTPSFALSFIAYVTSML